MSPAPAIDELLAPIADDAPAGKDCTGLPEYIKLASDVKKQRQEALAFEINALGGGGAGEMETGPGWKAIRTSAQTILKSRTKDLSVASWWTEASQALDGFPGLRAGLALTDGLICQYWETCFPLIDEDGDDDRRWGLLLGLEKLSEEVARTPLLSTPGADGAPRDLRLFDWRRATGKIRRPAPNTDEERAAEAAFVRDFESGWERAVVETEFSALKARFEEVQECIAAIEKLEASCVERFRPDPPPSPPKSLSGLRNALSECHRLLSEAVERRSAAGGGDGTVGATGTSAASSAGGSGAGGTRGAIAGRADAVQRMREVVTYFKVAEPHSPIPLLVERAIRWSEMPFPDLMRDMMENSDALFALDKLLGLKSPGESSE